MTLRLIGAGWSRTGTTSIKRALGVLGLRAYDMDDVFANPNHSALFVEALDNPLFDWERIYARYDAALDQPTHVFWRELVAAYPDAKVLLSVRDPDDWYESYKATIWGPTVGTMRGEGVDEQWAEMGRRVIVERAYDREPSDRATVIATFNTHNAEVRSTIASDRLLEYRVTEGWQPLCDFLELAVPDKPFPHLNRREDWPRRQAPNIAGRT